ncbi:MAG: hypothetical protein ACYSUN_11080, partial [Planctomycetota bacterium]
MTDTTTNVVDINQAKGGKTVATTTKKKTTTKRKARGRRKPAELEQALAKSTGREIGSLVLYDVDG